MKTEMTAAGAPDEVARTAMVDKLRGYRLAASPPVEAAMRAVPRHLFVPGIPLEQAYASDAIVTHRDADGIAVSSASAPSAVAGMLDQLDVRPGHRVLEIGAGTGYNAALLAHLTGSTGAVTTVDIDEDVADGARRGLAAAGYTDVSVICGDGVLGCPEHAPYDRIIITAGAWDLPPAWSVQLAPGGRIVVPLRMRGLTRSIAFERQDDCWRSRSIEELGFVPMRGAGAVTERNLRLGIDADIVLRVDDGQATDAQALSEALGHPATLAWTGAELPAGGLGHLDFWLAGLDGFARLLVTSQAAIGRGFVPPVYDWGSMAVFSRDTFAYLTERPAAHIGTPPHRGAELGVCAYGPGARRLAERVADQIQVWDQDRQSISGLSIEARSAGTRSEPGDLMVIDKHHTRLRVRTQMRPCS
jgi:protein-L-isoaspartate(D-aspartate) O-methyltransferase